MASSSYRADNRVEWFLQRVVTPEPHDVVLVMAASANANNENSHTSRKSPSFRVVLSPPNSHQHLQHHHHPGNQYFQDLLRNATAECKAREVVYAIYYRSPPGRFLVQDPMDHSWRNIGVEEAVEATQQAWKEMMMMTTRNRVGGGSCHSEQRIVSDKLGHSTQDALSSSWLSTATRFEQQQMVEKRSMEYDVCQTFKRQKKSHGGSPTAKKNEMFSSHDHFMSHPLSATAGGPTANIFRF